jgi:hypothetical protein
VENSAGSERAPRGNLLRRALSFRAMRARRSLLRVSLLAALTGVLLPSVAAADSLDATRYDLVERAHVVDVKVDRGFATLVVQRTVSNLGPKSDQATFHLSIPGTSVATRLRTAGTDAKGQVLWFEGELMEAEAAAAKYRELTGIGGYYPKDPALLSWRHQGYLALQVFPVPAQSSKTVEYTLKMPLAYEGGAYRVELPELGTEALSADVRVSAAHAEDKVSVNGVVGSPWGPSGGTINVRADRPITIELRPRGVPAVDMAFASVPISDGKHLVRGRIAAAAHVAEVPFGAHVVVLFDGSRSHHDADAGLVAVRAYLGHMTGATVDFLTYDREVRAPIGRSLPVRSALSKLATFQLEPRNGSRIDDALARADAILQTSPAAAKRVVVVTDTLTRSELTPEKVGAAAWKSGAVVHVATVASRGNGGVRRNDESPWATLPRRTGGLFWEASAGAIVDTTTRVAFEEWARPKRIDKLVVKGLTGELALSDVLDEGQGIEHFVLADAATSRVEISGELWSKPLRVSGGPTAEQNKLAAALFFGSNMVDDLPETEQMKLAMLGGAVSPVTSYLAIEPGVRPSNEGLEWGTVGFGSGGGGVGHGFGTGHGSLFGSGGAPIVDKAVWLRSQLGSILKTCAPSAKEVTASLESTLDEIVDVGRVELAPARDAKAESCVREEIWKLELPARTFDEAFETHTVVAKL